MLNETGAGIKNCVNVKTYIYAVTYSFTYCTHWLKYSTV